MPTVRRAMVSNPVWEICERMAEVQALLHDHIECGKRGRGGEGASRPVRARVAPGTVRCRLLPAEQIGANQRL
jgi:hypothetical protein